MPFATKYRPIQLEDVVGQFFVVETLKKAAINNKLSNAYLLSGSHGCGKTTIGRIIACLINCENPKNGEICGKCHACKSIMSDSSVDFLELNAASERGIDNIRQILEASRWNPQELKKKVYLIDEFQQLTNEANSALLKDLEEPMDHVVFILCTTAINKIPGTIVSRCQRFNFKKIPSSSILKRLKYICEQEGIKIEDNALSAICKISRGSLRDAVTFLEQIYTLKDPEIITEKFTSEYFCLADRSVLFDLLKSIIDRNVVSCLDKINDLCVASVEPKEILCELSELFRSIMIIKAKKDSFENIIDLPSFEVDALKEIGKDVKSSQLLKICEVFMEVERKLEYHINIRWVIESAVINCMLILKS